MSWFEWAGKVGEINVAIGWDLIGLSLMNVIELMVSEVSVLNKQWLWTGADWTISAIDNRRRMKVEMEMEMEMKMRDMINEVNDDDCCIYLFCWRGKENIFLEVFNASPIDSFRGVGRLGRLGRPEYFLLMLLL